MWSGGAASCGRHGECEMSMGKRKWMSGLRFIFCVLACWARRVWRRPSRARNSRPRSRDAGAACFAHHS